TCRLLYMLSFFFSSRRRHTRLVSDWSSDVCSSDLRPRLLADSPEAANNLGLALLARGDAAAAIAQFEAALRSRPDDAMLHNNLRSEERRVGKECRTRTRTQQ